MSILPTVALHDVRRARLRTAGAWVFVLGSSGAIALGIHAAVSSALPVRAYIRGEVPGASSLFEAPGGGFSATAQGGAVARPRHAGDLQAAAAPRSTAPIELREGEDGPARATVRLVGAADRPLSVEDGLALYRDAYPDVDVALRPQGKLVELLYVARAVPTHELRLAVSVGQGSSLHLEPTTRAAIATDASGRARLRVGAPVAIDARGHTRKGEYRVEGGALVVAMRWEGLTPPIVVDPAFTIPAWTILEDARVPGGQVYDPKSRSRETQIVHDAGRNRTVLVRPVRAQQPEDRTHVSAIAREGYERMAAQRISQIARTPGAGAAIGGSASADWQRGYALESETWEWDPPSAAWVKNDAAHLPGLIDTSLAFDARRGLVVAYGGASPALSCSRQYDEGDFFCTNGDPGDRTYEYDGTAWAWRSIPSSPPPRLRAAMAYDAAHQRVVLFGGRTLDARNPAHPVDENTGPAFPDNLAGDLRNDTWTYDGTAWAQVPTGNAPPAREGAQLVYDAARAVTVLVGGTTADAAALADALEVWEFDGSDWRARVHATDGALPRDLQSRRGAAAFYNPLRQRVTLFGGVSSILDPCTLTAGQIASARGAAQNDPVAMAQLAATGCIGGYVHDLWEWDGTSFTRAARASYGTTIAGQPVFQTLSGGLAWEGEGPAPEIDAGAPFAASPLWPWRYDPSPDHYRLRTSLERAYATAGSPPPPPADAGANDAGTDASAASAPPTLVSPAFASAARPDVAFDPVRGVATLFTSSDGAAYEMDGAHVARAATADSPFAAGVNDFFAAAWDSSQQRAVLFDPRTGATWTDGGAGWTRLVAANAPAPIAIDALRVQDLRRGGATAVATLSPRLPRAVFDRARGRTVMLYAGQVWELAGNAWTSTPVPSSLGACTVAPLVGFDGARGRTVIVGCTTPGQTWEWDGAQFYGPFIGPYQALYTRVHGPLAQPLPPWLANEHPWQGTLQLAHEHPNAVFESPSLGGVTTFDSDGTLRVWNGAAWTAGPALPSGFQCRLVEAQSSPAAAGFSTFWTYNFPVDLYTMTGREFVPVCAFPPAVEDRARHRVLAFRDGPRGMMELDAAPDAPDKAWHAAPLGLDGADWTGEEVADAQLFGFALESSTRVNPLPFEILTPEQVLLTTLSDPSRRTNLDGTPVQPPAAGAGQHVPSDWAPPEQLAYEPWWPFRFLDDPTTGRIRVLTHRGAMWELGGEDLKGLGETCTGDAQCAAGGCSAEGVCCDVKSCSDRLCMTCKGATPGTCAPVAAGKADVQGRCGAGECAGSCPGTATPPACTFDPTRACGPSPSCAAGRIAPGGHCAPAQTTCLTPDLVLPTCATVNGALVLSAPCIPPVTACGGGLGCSTASTCKQACATRLDCASRFDECSDGASCSADLASVAAAAVGVTSDGGLREPPPLRTNDEIAAMMVDAGYPTDDAGVVQLTAIAGVGLAFDPTEMTPTDGLGLCLDYLESCMMMNHTIDGCVAAAHRCVSPTPWLGDPAGNDCCPQACLVEYFKLRATLNEARAAQNFLHSSCYAEPGDGGAP